MKQKEEGEMVRMERGEDTLFQSVAQEKSNERSVGKCAAGLQ